ncbi:hypothetical protein ANN_12065 [Periplaneta americana]|uniref:Uncharacterized protein n=1 Tax=Periplaneta americana TaxID=6978 RepID=A0ABQ8T6S9_PERAM|nr:hypothetical protein ANN_12065 [Periplaneta americana]
MRYKSGPGAGRCERQPQLAQHRPLPAGDQLRDSGHPDGHLPAGLRGRDAVLERTPDEAGEYLQGDLMPRRMPPVWISHTHFVFQTDDGALAFLDTNNDSVSLLVTNHTLYHRTTVVEVVAICVSCSLKTRTWRQSKQMTNVRRCMFGNRAKYWQLQRLIDTSIFKCFLQRQLDVKGYQCSSDLRYILFRHNVKSTSTYGKLYLRHKPRTLEELRVQIEHACNDIPLATIQLVFRQSFTAHYTVYDVTNECFIVRLNAASLDGSGSELAARPVGFYFPPMR